MSEDTVASQRVRCVDIELCLRWRSSSAQHEDRLFVADYCVGHDRLGADDALLALATPGDWLELAVPTGLTFAGAVAIDGLGVRVLAARAVDGIDRLPYDAFDLLAAGLGAQALPFAALPVAAAPLARRDTSPDPLFYARPRLVDHLDALALGQLAELHGRLLPPEGSILDLMASVNSHLPPTDAWIVVGLGLNREELTANPRLAGRLIADLNARPVLPLQDGCFDAALCALSIEYLLDPVAVLRELARVLRLGAPCIVSFSERGFPPKVTAQWLRLRPFERVALVRHWFERSGAFGDIVTFSQRGWPRPTDDRHIAFTRQADPLYAVLARRR